MAKCVVNVTDIFNLTNYATGVYDIDPISNPDDSSVLCCMYMGKLIEDLPDGYYRLELHEVIREVHKYQEILIKKDYTIEPDTTTGFCETVQPIMAATLYDALMHNILSRQETLSIDNDNADTSDGVVLKHHYTSVYELLDHIGLTGKIYWYVHPFLTSNKVIQNMIDYVESRSLSSYTDNRVNLD
jgi:hypothetical protein